MYVEYFRFSEAPFRITPDARYFFGSGTHKKALAYATYGIDKAEGFIVITGEIGSGKTTVIDYLTSRIDPKRHHVANIVSTQLSADSLVQMVASAFELRQRSENKALVLSEIQSCLRDRTRRGSRSLLIIDDAQNLSRESLEELRMLSNFQEKGAPLLQILLAGQPELRQTLARPDMEQLSQRVIAHHHIDGLSEEETLGYIQHRLNQAGWENDPRIAEVSFREIYRLCGGIPRRINILCDRLLLSCYLDEKHAISMSDVREVAQELKNERGDPRERSVAVGELGKNNFEELTRIAWRIRDLEREVRDLKSGLKTEIDKLASRLQDG